MADEQHPPVTYNPQVSYNPQVTYDIGDLLDKMGTRIDAGFASVGGKLDSKADKSDMAEIRVTLLDHGREIGHLNDWRRTTEAATQAVTQARSSRLSSSQWRIGTLISVLMGLSGWAVLIFYLAH